uniref:Transmembrane protein 14C n=1 Tax=Rhinopithecus bieti TaxID=61621 RepID=A0A2K6LKF4_RHIBE
MEKSPFPLVPLHWFGFGYTALVVSGGIVGYVKTGRVPSLAAGLLFGSLAGLGSYRSATSVTFVGVMGLRSYYYGKVMSVGLIAGASFFALVVQAGVQCCDFSSLQPPPPGFNSWYYRCLPPCQANFLYF